MTISCWRLAQPAKINNKNASADGTEPIRKAYPGSSFVIMDSTGKPRARMKARGSRPYPAI